MNQSFSKIWIIGILIILISGGIFNGGIVNGKEISNPLKAQPSELINSLFQWIKVLVITAIPIFIWFLIFYLLIKLGFKILKIAGIPRSKIVVYIFSMFLLSLFLNSAIPIVIKDASNRFILYFANFLISFLVVFLLLKYYFVLSGKKLWQFLLYLLVLNLIFYSIFFGLNVLQHRQVSKEEVKVPEEKIEEIIPEKVVEDETADTSTSSVQDWQTYRNEEYGYEIKYPAPWQYRIGSASYCPVDIKLCYNTYFILKEDPSKTILVIYNGYAETSLFNYLKIKTDLKGEEINIQNNSQNLTTLFLISKDSRKSLIVVRWFRKDNVKKYAEIQMWYTDEKDENLKIIDQMFSTFRFLE